jgi:hypothetical protein
VGRGGFGISDLAAGMSRRRAGYDECMSEMADHERERPVEIDGVPEGEEIDEGDAAERIDEDPDEQPNRHDPVWDDEEHED